VKAKKFNTIGLNMIIGPGDGNNLKRCLESIDAKNFFDEIILVLTTRDPYTERIARSFTNKVYFQQWACERYPYGNFSRARNYALDKSTTDFIWWLDCDDIYPEECLERLPFIKEGIGDDYCDYYVVDYRINYKDKKNFGACTIRERIFRREDKTRWYRPVHEELSVAGKKGTLKGIWIEHRETKPAIASIGRNITILKHEIDMGRADDILKSFYAIELLGTGKDDSRCEAIDLLKEIFYNNDMPPMLLASMAAKLSIELLKDENYVEAEIYSRASLGIHKGFAEPHIVLGDIYSFRNEIDKALILYSEALSKELFIGGSQNVSYYKETPTRRIMSIYIDREEYEMALVFNRRALGYLPGNEYLLDIRKEIISKLTEE